ncbi:MAG: phosphoglycerate kinase [Patescibacteria group bacterium]
MLKFISDISKDELKNKKILLRVDFDVPIIDGKIIEDFRIKAHKETIEYLLNNGAKIMLVSHLGHEVSDVSFFPIVEQIGEVLGQTITLVPHSELSEVGKLFEVADVFLLDNIRQDKREAENDDKLALSLSKDFDYYVNDDFATAHRKHASIVAITKHLPSYAGFLIKKETENLKRAVDTPLDGKVLVLGGAKISTKMPVIKNFIDKAEKILIGGALANNFFQAQGISVGASVIDDSAKPDARSENIILPRDFITTEKNGDSSSVKLYNKAESVGLKEAILDIGPETAEEWAEIIERAKMVIWNGPMGYYEHKDFEEGTEIIAEAVAKVEYSIVGGGDTIVAVNKFGLLDRYTFVSTGGGSMLEFLAGNKLPGLDALGYYD